MKKEKKIIEKYGANQQFTHRQLIPANLQVAGKRSSLKKRLEVLRTSTEGQRPSVVPSGRILEPKVVLRNEGQKES